MKQRLPFIYFSVLTLVLLFLLGMGTWHGNDTEFRYRTAIRMHACDILENGHSTLLRFDPGECDVKRKEMWLGQRIDVSCVAIDTLGNERHFSHGYSDSHRLFNYAFEKTYTIRHGGHCNG